MSESSDLPVLGQSGERDPRVALAIGDRVLILRPGQPWHNEAGVIEREFREQGLSWIVRLDSTAGTSGCEARHLRRLT